MNNVSGQPHKNPYATDALSNTGAKQHQFCDYQLLAAAGSSQATGGQITVLSGGYVRVTGANATLAVVLPPAQEGYILHLKNVGAAVLPVFPAVGGTINALGPNAALSMAASTSATFVCDGTNWATIPLLPS